MTDAVIAMNEAKRQGANRGGRPDKIGDWHVERAREYVEGKWKHNPDGERDHVVPTLEGLAGYLDISRQSLYEAEELSYWREECNKLQAQLVLQGGLANEFNASISKLILGRHGYVERTATDVTTNGESLQVKPTSTVAIGFAEFTKQQTIEGELVEQPNMLTPTTEQSLTKPSDNENHDVVQPTTTQQQPSIYPNPKHSHQA